MPDLNAPALQLRHSHLVRKWSYWCDTLFAHGLVTCEQYFRRPRGCGGYGEKGMHLLREDSRALVCTVHLHGATRACDEKAG